MDKATLLVQLVVVAASLARSDESWVESLPQSTLLLSPDALLLERFEIL